MTLSPQVFQILLSLHEAPRHGYSIIQNVRARTNDEMQLTASTLYDAIARLSDQELIEEVAEPTTGIESEQTPDDRPDGRLARRDKRRRYYALTAAGREAVAAETRRLERTVEMARAMGVRTVDG